MTTVAVVDYGMGNLRSVAKAIEHVAPAIHVRITSDPAEVMQADRIVVPGQGAMPDCMRELEKCGLREAVIRSAASKPWLGICIGLQMLFDYSEEGGVAGLGILAGNVRRFPHAEMALANGTRLKVPHMGWNEVQQTRTHALWNGIDDGARFYFVHSYYVDPVDPGVAIGLTQYGVPFTSAVARDNMVAVQFHPEKSAQAGLQLLSNFMCWNP